MASVHDVAAAILQRKSPLDTWKLEKLAYYSQAWHLVWENEPLFRERIEAWADGPVCRDLYDHHRGDFMINTWRWGDSSRLSQPEVDTIGAVVSAYGGLSGRQLSSLTHAEAPWRDARIGLHPGERSNREITWDAMLEYYRAIADDPEAESIESISPDDL